MKRFTRTIEDFICEGCEALVTGNGYTNHCPKCLWSKHVDINPGDRSAHCGGMMKPIKVELKHGVPQLLHRCIKCGLTRRQSADPADSAELLRDLLFQ